MKAEVKMIRNTLVCFAIIFLCIVKPTFAITYYVNDAVLNGNDTYTTAVGNNGNVGTSPASPKLTIMAVVALGLVAGDIVYIDGGTFVEEVLLSSVNGTAGSRILLQGNGTTKTIIRGVADGAVIPYALKLFNSSYITVQNLKIEGIPAEWGIQIYNNSTNNIITNCLIVADQYGIDIYRASGGTGGPSPQNNTVQNCTVNANYVGIRIKSYRSGSTWAAYAASGPMNNVVTDNVVSVSGAVVYAALELQATRTNSILRNRFSSTGNTDVGTIALIHICTGQIIENNYAVNHSPQGAGIYYNPAVFFDDNSGASFTHNSFYSESYTFYFGDGDASGTLTNVNLINNILYSKLKDCISFPVDAAAKFNSCDGNMYYAPAGNVASVTVTNMNFAQWQAYLPGGGNEANGFNANPSYMAPASDNLDLNSGSPAIDVVNVATSVSNDIYSISRPQGAKKDVGAYETVVAPITLIYFAASCNQEKVTVTWVTACEIDNDYFVLEKSASPDKDFVEVTRVDGRGAGTCTKATTYQFVDTFNSSTYYRLKQVDIDGNFTYTNITQSNCTSQKVLVVNFGEYMDIRYPGASVGNEIQVSIINMKGQELMQKTAILSSDHSIQVTISELASAMYILSVKNGTEVFTTKFVKE